MFLFLNASSTTCSFLRVYIYIYIIIEPIVIIFHADQVRHEGIILSSYGIQGQVYNRYIIIKPATYFVLRGSSKVLQSCVTDKQT